MQKIADVQLFLACDEDVASKLFKIKALLGNLGLSLDDTKEETLVPLSRWFSTTESSIFH